jgi:hypothetical protein
VLARLLEVPLADLKHRLSDEDKTFVWLKRQVDEPVAKQIAALGIKGIYQRAGYKLLASEPHHSFGHDLVGETWELELD